MFRKLREFSHATQFEVSAALEVISGGAAAAFRIGGETETLYPEELPPLEIRPGVDLWKRTCLEVFFFEKESSRYVELNWNVLGEHALLSFEDYRRPAAPGDALETVGFRVRRIERSKRGSRLESRLELDLPRSASFLVWPTAVLCPRGSPKLYYARSHRERPDFHAREVAEPSADLLTT